MVNTIDVINELRNRGYKITEKTITENKIRKDVIVINNNKTKTDLPMINK